MIDHLTALRKDVNNLNTRYSDLGGPKKLQEIQKANAERDRMMEYLSQRDQANPASVNSSNSLVEAAFAAQEQQTDPALAKEI